MKKGVIIFVALLLFVLFAAVEVLTQEQSELQTVTVKNSTVTNGVVILDAQQGTSPFELRCNKDSSSCTILDPGKYFMVRLPKNRGMYDCANVDVYRMPGDLDTGNKIGEYCLVAGK
jgi:hypothetical protein